MILIFFINLLAFVHNLLKKNRMPNNFFQQALVNFQRTLFMGLLLSSTSFLAPSLKYTAFRLSQSGLLLNVLYKHFSHFVFVSFLFCIWILLDSYLYFLQYFVQGPDRKLTFVFWESLWFWEHLLTITKTHRKTKTKDNFQEESVHV